MPIHRPCRAVAFLPLSIALVAGCSAATRPAGGSSVPRQSAGYVSADVIERSGARTLWEALRQTVPYLSLTDATRGRRAHLARRGTSSILLRDEPRVFIDNTPISDVSVLAQLPASDIFSIQLLSGLDGTTRYGTNSGDGIILIATKMGSAEAAGHPAVALRR